MHLLAIAYMILLCKDLSGIFSVCTRSLVWISEGKASLVFMGFIMK